MEKITTAYVAQRLNINGIVQGVGFRPYVFQLAHLHNLKGEVANTSSGVTIHLEGASEDITAFEHDLTQHPPPLAVITTIERHDAFPRHLASFTIIKSEAQAGKSTLISPDVAICDDCLNEMRDPEDRRHQYPFINCTNCGPRYTIIDDIPYDRPKTSMRHFTMCPQCQFEYDDPNDRRFHAQPNACAACGPQVQLFTPTREAIAVPDPIAHTAELLRQGQVLAIKGLGGFHLAADAENNAAVKRLRKAKHREEKPFALMAPDLDAVRQFALFESSEAALLTAFQRPIVLLAKRHPNTIAEQVAPRNAYFGVMLPYTPLHYLLMTHGFTALVMTSGNMSEEPIAIGNEDAFQRLADIADYFLVHDRDIYLRSDDSIVRHLADETRVIRRSRGYVPRPIFLKPALPRILACGAELKNTICLTRDNQAFLSQHIGDLENVATNDFFKLTVKHLQRILDITPEAIAYDLHPDYLSTVYAKQRTDLVQIPVQHHHAHIASCMAEHHLEGRVMGLAFDGTGYGTDGKIWGGEVLIADSAAFIRAAHWRYVAMPGSTAAIKEPWRMAISYLFDAYGEEAQALQSPLWERLDAGNVRIISEMITKNINAPMTSSLGRLFDGVAAILGIRDTVVFEGQAAMELEMVADTDTQAVYDYAWENGSPVQILPQPIIAGVIDDMRKGTPVAVISGKFHQTLIRLFTDLAQHLRTEYDVNRVVLSGGSFQNAILLQGFITALRQQGFEVFAQQQVPTNDGGIALGQAMVAAAQLNA